MFPYARMLSGEFASTAMDALARDRPEHPDHPRAARADAVESGRAEVVEPKLSGHLGASAQALALVQIAREPCVWRARSPITRPLRWLGGPRRALRRAQARGVLVAAALHPKPLRGAIRLRGSRLIADPEVARHGRRRGCRPRWSAPPCTQRARSEREAAGSASLQARAPPRPRRSACSGYARVHVPVPRLTQRNAGTVGQRPRLTPDGPRELERRRIVICEQLGVVFDAR
jgi:hypothetical protein